MTRRVWLLKEGQAVLFFWHGLLCRQICAFSGSALEKMKKLSDTGQGRERERAVPVMI